MTNYNNTTTQRPQMNTSSNKAEWILQTSTNMKLLNDNSIGFNNNHVGIHRPRAVNQPQPTSAELNSFRRIKYNFLDC